MKAIKDSVHDHIDVTGIARELLDTPAVQRLRRVSQLGTVSLVYPSANHTRFEHSIGVYHLASKAVTQLDLPAHRAKELRAAALLHDIGHAPFSHNIEPLFYHRTGKYHDDVDELIRTGAVGDTLRAHDLSPDRIADLIAGKGKYAAVISGELDVDRMDYLVRDAHHTGVPYGTIDPDRLIRNLVFQDDELVLAAGNVQSAESLLIARSLMTPTVYNHHVTRIGKSMLRRGTERLLAVTDWTADKLRRVDDPRLRIALRECDAANAYIRRLENRKLFKRAIWAELRTVPESVIDAPIEKIRTWEREIAEQASVSEDEVILDVPPRPEMTETTSKVIVAGEARSLGEQSPLVEALRESHRSQWRLGVYTTPEQTDSVGTAATRVLGLNGAPISDRSMETISPLSDSE